MDDFPSLRSLEGIGRSLGTERPPFSPSTENDLTQPSGAKEASGRERPEERFEARIEEAERRARSERSRDTEEESRNEVRSREESNAAKTEESSSSKHDSDGAQEGVDEEAVQAHAGGQKPVAKETVASLRFAGAEPATPLGTLLPEVQATSPATSAPGQLAGGPDLTALELGKIPAAPQAAVGALDYGTVSIDEPLDALRSLLNPTLTDGQGAAGGDTSNQGGESKGSGTLNPAASSGSSTTTAVAAEAFGAMLSSESSDGTSSVIKSATAESAARSSTPSQREIEQAGDVLRQFRMQLQPGLNQATIHLRPAHLGRVAIRLHVEEGRLRATLRAEKPETLSILESHLPELRAALEGQGFEAQEFDLGLGDSESPGFQDFFQGEESTPTGQPKVSATPKAILDEGELLRDALQQRLDSNNPSVDTYA